MPNRSRSRTRPPAFRPGLCALFAAACLIVSSGWSGAQSAAEIQQLVRHSQAQVNISLKGRLQTSKPKRKVDFTLDITAGTMRFQFATGETLTVGRQGGQPVITRTVNGKTTPVPPGAFGDAVGGTDATYEDLAMRFLDWDTATVKESKLIKGRDSWVLDIPSPTDLKVLSPYSRVYAYVDKASGALLRVDAFDWEGRATKTYEVVSGQKVDGLWFLKKMKIETIDPATKKTESSTTLYLIPPK